MDTKKHWEEIYSTKSPEEVSWTQDIPSTSLRLIHEANVAKDAAIIDVGGGDSKLVDFLVHEGYTNVSVLDISSRALERAKARLGDKANLVQWIEADINFFLPKQHYAIWHDRAVFHFLTENKEVQHYSEIVSKYTTGRFIVGTFSENGPLKCSGIAIKQYAVNQLELLYGHSFKLITSFQEDHTTPFNTIQNFTFASFERKYSVC